MQIITELRALLVYFLPLVIGRGLVLGLKQVRKMSWWKELVRLREKREEDEVEKWQALPAYYAWGVVVILVWALGFRYWLTPLVGLSWKWGFFGGVWLVGLFCLGVNIVSWWRKPVKLEWRSLVPIGVVTLLASGVIWLWVYRSPYPLNWDWYQHQTLSRIIQEGKFEFETSKMSDTFQFNSYPPTIHLLHALGQFPGSMTPQRLIDYWRGLSFLHLISVGLVSWLLAFVVVRKPVVGFLGGVFGVMIFDSAFSFTNLFFLPQTLAAVVFTGAFAFLLNALQREKTLPWWQAWGVITVLPLIHYSVGTLAMLVYGAFWVYSKLKQKVPKLRDRFPFVYLVVLAVVVGLMVSGYIDLDYLNQGEAALYRFSLEEKKEFVENIYGYGMYLLVPLGVVYAFLNEKRRMSLGISLVMLFGFGAVVLADLPYVVKFYTLGRFWFHLFMVMGVWGLLQYVKQKYVMWLVSMGVVGTVAAMLVVNVVHWKNGLLHDGEYTHISDLDISAAEFLAEKYYGQKGVLMISDPATQFILEGLSGVDSVGGAYMVANNRRILHQIMMSSKPDEVLKQMALLHDGILENSTTKLLVVSGRTFAWAEVEEKDRLSLKFNIWTPKQLAYEDEKWIYSLERGDQIRLVYTSPGEAIFEVR